MTSVRTAISRAHQDSPIPGILLLYQDSLSASAPTILEHVNAFERYSRFPVWAVNTQLGFPTVLKELRFRAIVLHYSLFGRYPFLISERFVKYLESSEASFKVALFQDEHQNCPQRFALIDRLNIGAIYSLLEPAEYERVYLSHTRCRNVYHTLTGYVDDSFVDFARAQTIPDIDRTIDVGYRGRPLAYFMGKGAQEKTRIADECIRRLDGSGLRLDIRTGERDRIYGDDWYRFVANCRAMIGVESGVSVFDLTGEVKAACDDYLRTQPGAEFDEVYRQILLPWEGNVYYRTISPRVFEAAAFRVCMILFEGRYNDILKPMVHYIPLRKDFSNFDWVMDIYRDPVERKRLTENAYNDLIASGNYSYRRFIEQFDGQLERLGLEFQITGESTSRITELLAADQAQRKARTRSKLRVRLALGRVLRSIPGNTVINRALMPARHWYRTLKWAKF